METDQKLPCLEVVIGDPRKPPDCPHGPTLLFRRFMGGEERLFYACSACRERKACRFFLWANEDFDDSKKKIWELEAQKVLPKIDHTKLYVKLMQLLQSPNNRAFCHDCNELLSSNNAEKHIKHDVVTDLTDHQITHPSELLKPLENAKKEAQYLFSKKSTETIVSALKKLGCKHILCIGAPRIHEYILAECSAQMDSLLLDIDHRYHQFHGPLQFCWYNVFNNYYFNKSTSAQIVNEFLQQDSGKGIAIFIDPPFGGRVEPLANTIQQITKQHRSLNANVHSDMPVLWTFPYFMESFLLSSLPEYKMLDYKVDYDNHPLFSRGPNGRKFGSPVRIFTNVSPKAIPLPEEEGYRFCKPCKRWVSKENKHCKQCSKCTSKDGHTYVHCSICERCVKPSWAHCETCQRCCMKGHKCSEFKPYNLCYHCGEPGHKKADCKVGPKKRKLQKSDTVDNVTKKQKMEKPNHSMNGVGSKVKTQKIKMADKPVTQQVKKTGKFEKEAVAKNEKVVKVGAANNMKKKQKIKNKVPAEETANNMTKEKKIKKKIPAEETANNMKKEKKIKKKIPAAEIANMKKEQKIKNKIPAAETANKMKKKQKIKKKIPAAETANMKKYQKIKNKVTNQTKKKSKNNLHE